MAGIASIPGRRGRIIAEINITPLTDIFLVLLIIFMVTSVAMVDSGAKVMLPELQGDREVMLGEAVRILSAAQHAGATQVAIAAERGRPAAAE